MNGEIKSFISAYAKSLGITFAEAEEKVLRTGCVRTNALLKYAHRVKKGEAGGPSIKARKAKAPKAKTAKAKGPLARKAKTAPAKKAAKPKAPRAPKAAKPTVSEAPAPLSAMDA